MAKLPPELTDRVIDFLHSDKRSLVACSLVCNSWAPTSRYHLFREIIITPANSQAFSDLFGSAATKDVTSFNEQQPSLISRMDKVPKGTEYSNYVHKVSWTVVHEEWLVGSIMQILSSLPLLSEFFVTRSGCISCPPFGFLKGIKTFSFKGYLQNVVPEIATVIANSPELEYLDISRRDFCDGGYTPHVREFFARISPGSPPLKLKHLGVGEMRLGPDATIVPHIRSLTSLEWFPWDLEDGDAEASSEEFWKILKSERISLSRLKTSVMNEELLDFLSSSQGISELHLERTTSRYDDTPNPLARTFFQYVLPLFTDTLKVLYIEAVYEGDWCFGENNLASILNCTYLEELMVSIFWPEPADYSSSAPVDLLLDNVLQLPHLRFLEILPAIFAYRAQPRLRKIISDRRNEIYAAILRAVRRFEDLVGDDPVGLPGYELRVREERKLIARA